MRGITKILTIQNIEKCKLSTKATIEEFFGNFYSTLVRLLRANRNLMVRLIGSLNSWFAITSSVGSVAEAVAALGATCFECAFEAFAVAEPSMGGLVSVVVAAVVAAAVVVVVVVAELAAQSCRPAVVVEVDVAFEAVGYLVESELVTGCQAGCSQQNVVAVVVDS